MVSADGHAGAPFATYRDYLDEKYRADFDSYDRAEIALVPDALPFAAVAVADREEVAHRLNFADPAARVEDHESMGVVAEVLFPGATPSRIAPWSDFLSMVAFRIRTPRGRELQSAGEKAYNRWLADFCSYAPRRLLGLAHLPLHDRDAALAEVEWAAEQQMAGVLLPFFNYDLPEYIHLEHWEPLWRACAERELTLNFHGGYGNADLGHHSSLQGLDDWATRVLGHFIFSGAFDAIPELRVAITELGGFWVPGALKRLDGVYARARAAADSKKRAVRTVDTNLPARAPSAYWGENCFVGTSALSPQELEIRADIGVNAMMYGLDYPHSEGSWGKNTLFLQSSFGRTGVGEADARAILGGNAARMYQVDLDVLGPIVERIGPTIEDVLTSATEDQTRELLDEFRSSKRVLAATHFEGDLAVLTADDA